MSSPVVRELFEGWDDLPADLVRTGAFGALVVGPKRRFRFVKKSLRPQSRHVTMTTLQARAKPSASVTGCSSSKVEDDQNFIHSEVSVPTITEKYLTGN